jgi:hypothetical protein
LARAQTHLFNKVRHFGKVLDEVELEVAARRGATAEGGRGPDNDHVGVFLAGALDGGGIVVEGREHLGVLVGLFHEALAFLVENVLGAGSVGVDEGYDLEARAELVLEAERVVPRALVRAEHDVLESAK